MATPNKSVIDYKVNVRVTGVSTAHTSAAVSSAITTALNSLGFGAGAHVNVKTESSNSALEINTRKVPPR